jgi:hypothetical protein
MAVGSREEKRRKEKKVKKYRRKPRSSSFRQTVKIVVVVDRSVRWQSFRFAYELAQCFANAGNLLFPLPSLALHEQSHLGLDPFRQCRSILKLNHAVDHMASIYHVHSSRKDSPPTYNSLYLTLPSEGICDSRYIKLDKNGKKIK